MKIQSLDYQLKNITSPQGKIGLVLLATDFHTLYEFDPILKDTGILCFPSRIYNESQINKTTLLAMEEKLAFASSLILPEQDLDVVAFSCTAASMVIGEDKIDKTIKKDGNNRVIKATTNPISALKNVIEFLKIKKLTIITPYTDEVTQGIVNFISSLAVEVDQVGSFKEESDNNLPHITPHSIVNACVNMAKHSKAKHIFISCTSLNIVRYIDKIEKLTQKTVITSNQIMLWHALKLCNYTKPISGFGQLLSTTN